MIGEKKIADAVIDRIVHHSLRVELYGESFRRRKINRIMYIYNIFVSK